MTLSRRARSFVRRHGWKAAVRRAALYPIWPVVQRLKWSRIERARDAESRFTEIYRLNYWGSADSSSGAGSSLHATESIRRELPRLLDRFGVETLLDAPCGDLHWMKEVLAGYRGRYIGGEIVKDLVDRNARLFGRDDRLFVHLDITRDALPNADLFLCRDCLFHLSNGDVWAVLRNFADSSIAYMLATTYKRSAELPNEDIRTGDFRHLDLFAPPFSLPKDVLARFDDWHGGERPREMCLWSRAQIRQALDAHDAADAAHGSARRDEVRP